MLKKIALMVLASSALTLQAQENPCGDNVTLNLEREIEIGKPFSKSGAIGSVKEHFSEKGTKVSLTGVSENKGTECITVKYLAKFQMGKACVCPVYK